MKSASSKLCLVLVSSALILAGCTKKPLRPDPTSTVMPNQGADNSGLSQQNVATDQNSMNGLQGRDLAAFDANGQARGLLGDPVYFDTDKSAIKPSERAKLQGVKDYLDKNPTVKVLIEGHCDWRGTAEYNLALGDRRANEAKKYLVGLGVSPDKIETVSKGSEEAQKQADGAAMVKDRRDDLIVVKGT